MKNTSKVVFLSGPMRGVLRSEGLGWRNKIKDILGPNFKILHAYRGREEKETFTDSRLAIIRDKNDISKSDIVIVNDTYSKVSMIGTAMEVFFAYSLNKVVIIFGEAHLNDYWLNFHSHVRVKSLEEACDIVTKFFVD
jgi:nucleoside 2-deoxyribosyltransferase